jgi:DNA-binding NarL/FixJ family response regulator
MNLFILFLFALFFILDIYTNLQEGVPVPHVWHEVVLFSLAFGAMILQIRTILKKNARILVLNKELLHAKESYQEWKNKSRASARELRTMIDQQFSSWELSISERDVALLLIKGFSMKEIAEFRNTHEKTVRHQATTIYRKSGLPGRQALAAFFLEDILGLPD